MSDAGARHDQIVFLGSLLSEKARLAEAVRAVEAAIAAYEGLALAPPMRMPTEVRASSTTPEGRASSTSLEQSAPRATLEQSAPRATLEQSAARATPAAPPSPQPGRSAGVERASRLDDGMSQTATFELVNRFAVEQHIEFREWVDLPRVNAKRDELKLPRFRQPFGILK
jgi:hypothetical protein